MAVYQYYVVNVALCNMTICITHTVHVRLLYLFLCLLPVILLQRDKPYRRIYQWDLNCVVTLSFLNNVIVMFVVKLPIPPLLMATYYGRKFVLCIRSCSSIS